MIRTLTPLPAAALLGLALLLAPAAAPRAAAQDAPVEEPPAGEDPAGGEEPPPEAPPPASPPGGAELPPIPEQPPLEEVGPRMEPPGDAPRKVRDEIEKALEAYFLNIFNNVERPNAMGRLQKAVLEWNADLVRDAERKKAEPNHCLRDVRWWLEKVAATYPTDNPKKRRVFLQQGWNWPGAPGSSLDFFVNVPNNYRAKGELWPLILTSLPKDADFKTVLKDRYGDLLETHIVVASMEGAVMGQPRQTFHAFMHGILNYRIDRDRVVLDGLGKGSTVVDYFAPDAAVHFAGAIFRSPASVHPAVGNSELFPCLVETSPSPSGAVATALEALKAANPETVVLRVQEGRAGGPEGVLSREDADRKVQEWIAALPPRRISDPTSKYTWRATTEGVPQVWGYWYLVDEVVDHAPDLNVEVTWSLEAKHNLVEIEASNLSRGTLLLNDSVLDLDYPVVVRVNGVQVLKSKVVRSIDTALQWMSPTNGGRKLFVTATLPFEVPPEARIPLAQREALRKAQEKARQMEKERLAAEEAAKKEDPPKEGGAPAPEAGKEEDRKEAAPPPAPPAIVVELEKVEVPVPAALEAALSGAVEAGKPLLLLFAPSDHAVAKRIEEEVLGGDDLKATFAKFAFLRVPTEGDGSEAMRTFQAARFREDAALLLGVLKDDTHNLGRLNPLALEEDRLGQEIGPWLEGVLELAAKKAAEPEPGGTDGEAGSGKEEPAGGEDPKPSDAKEGEAKEGEAGK